MEFEYTGGSQQITLDPNQYLFVCDGAPGGTTTTTKPCVGARVYGVLDLQSTNDFYVNVGGVGSQFVTIQEATNPTSEGGSIVIPGKPAVLDGGAGGFNGGAKGNTSGCGGGGATDIRIGTNDLNHRLIVAAGGGGHSTNTATGEFDYAGDGGAYYGGYPHIEGGFDALKDLPELQEAYAITQNTIDFHAIFHNDTWLQRLPNRYIPLKYAYTVGSTTSSGSGSYYFNASSQYIGPNTKIIIKVKVNGHVSNSTGARNVIITTQNSGLGATSEADGFTLSAVRESATVMHWELHEAQRKQWGVRRNELIIPSDQTNAFGVLTELEITFSPNPSLKATPITIDTNGNEVRGTTYIGTQNESVKNTYLKHTTHDQNMIFFALTQNGATKSNATFYDCKIYQNHTQLEHNYVPVFIPEKEVPTNAYIYDRATNEVLENDSYRLWIPADSRDIMYTKRIDTYLDDTNDYYSESSFNWTYTLTEGQNKELSFDVEGISINGVTQFDVYRTIPKISKKTVNGNPNYTYLEEVTSHATGISDLPQVTPYFDKVSRDKTQDGRLHQHISFQQSYFNLTDDYYHTDESHDKYEEMIVRDNQSRIQNGLSRLYTTDAELEALIEEYITGYIDLYKKRDAEKYNTIHFVVDDQTPASINILRRDETEYKTDEEHFYALYGKVKAIHFNEETLQQVKIAYCVEQYEPGEPPELTEENTEERFMHEAICIDVNYPYIADKLQNQYLTTYWSTVMLLSTQVIGPTTELEMKCCMNEDTPSSFSNFTLVSAGNTENLGKSNDPKLPQFHIYFGYGNKLGLMYVRTHQTADGNSAITTDTFHSEYFVKIDTLKIKGEIVILKTEGEFLKVYAEDGELIYSVPNAMVPPTAELPFSDFNQSNETSFYKTITLFNDAKYFMQEKQFSDVSGATATEVPPASLYTLKIYDGTTLRADYVSIDVPYIQYYFIEGGENGSDKEEQFPVYKAELIDVNHPTYTKQNTFFFPKTDDIYDVHGIYLNRYFRPHDDVVLSADHLSIQDIEYDRYHTLIEEGYLRTNLIRNLQVRDVNNNTTADYVRYKGIVYPSQEIGYAFGTGMDAIIDGAGGAGGGWYGGYTGTNNGGSGSSYVYTASSYKPTGYMTNTDCYLTDTYMEMGGVNYAETLGKLVTTPKASIYVKANTLYPNDEITFLATGRSEQITLPAGKYKLLCVGGDGGYRYTYESTINASDVHYQLGGYASGFLQIEDGTKDLFVNVGGSGVGNMLTDDVLAMHMHNGLENAKEQYITRNKPSISYNGGGIVDYPGSNGKEIGYGRITGGWGGGATDIRLDQNEYLNRILVAGGAGGMGSVNRFGTCGGGTNGQDSPNTSYNGYNGGYGKYNQASTYTGNSSIHGNVVNAGFGYGGNGYQYHGWIAGAGGGGWYGGSGTFPNNKYDTNSREGYGGSGWAWGATNNKYTNAPNGYVLKKSTSALSETTYLTGIDHNGDTVSPYMPATRVTTDKGYGHAYATITVDDISYLKLLCRDAEGVKYYDHTQSTWVILHGDGSFTMQDFQTYGYPTFPNDEGLLNDFEILSLDETGYTRAVLFDASPKQTKIVAYTDSNIGVQEVRVDYDADANYDLQYRIEKTGTTKNDPLRVEITVTKSEHIKSTFLKLYYIQLNGKSLFDEKFFQEGKWNYFKNRDGVKMVETPKPPLGQENDFYDTLGNVKTFQSLLQVQNGMDLDMRFVNYLDNEYALLKPRISNTVICERDRCLYIGSVIWMSNQPAGLDYRFYVRKYALISGTLETIFDLPVSKFKTAHNNTNSKFVYFNGIAVNDEYVILAHSQLNKSECLTRYLSIVERDNPENVRVSTISSEYGVSAYGKLTWWKDKSILFMMGATISTDVRYTYPAIMLYDIPSNSWGIHRFPSSTDTSKEYVIDYAIGKKKIVITRMNNGTTKHAGMIFVIDKDKMGELSTTTITSLPDECISIVTLNQSNPKRDGNCYVCYHDGLFYIVQKDTKENSGQLFVYDENEERVIVNITDLLWTDPTNVTYVKENTLCVQNAKRFQYIYQINDLYHPEENITYKYTTGFPVPNKDSIPEINTNYKDIENDKGVNHPIAINGYYFIAKNHLTAINNIGNAKYNAGFKFKRQIVYFNRENAPNLEYDPNAVQVENSCMIIGGGSLEYPFEQLSGFDNVYSATIHKNDYDYLNDVRFLSIVEDATYQMKVNIRSLVYVNGRWDDNNDIVLYPNVSRETLISELFDKHSSYYDATHIAAACSDNQHILLHHQIGFYRQDETFISKTELLYGRNQFVELPEECAKFRILLTYDVTEKELLDTSLNTCELTYQKGV